jgi:hypothetical protein
MPAVHHYFHMFYNGVACAITVDDVAANPIQENWRMPLGITPDMLRADPRLRGEHFVWVCTVQDDFSKIIGKVFKLNPAPSH